MKKQVILTVAESKRLIAKGVAALPEVQGAMEAGMVVPSAIDSDAMNAASGAMRALWSANAAENTPVVIEA